MRYLYYSEQMDLGDLAAKFKERAKDAEDRQDVEALKQIAKEMSNDPLAKSWGWQFEYDGHGIKLLGLD